MALTGQSNLYPKWKDAIMAANADASILSAEGATTGVHVALVDADVYTYDATHTFHSDLTGIVADSQEIINKSVLNGVFDGDDVTFPGVVGPTTEAIVIYRKTAGLNSTWRLVAYIEQVDVVNLPLTPNGGDVEVNWNALGIFKL